MTVTVEALGAAQRLAAARRLGAAQPLDPARREEWESFVAGAANGTLFHRLAFLDYHPLGRFDFHHLLFRQEGRLVAVLPGALERGEEGTGGAGGTEESTFSSPAGASFGGPVLARGLERETVAEVLAALAEEARRERWVRVRLGPPPEFYEHDYERGKSHGASRAAGAGAGGPGMSSPGDAGRGASVLFSALEAAGWRPAATEVTQVVPLQGTEEDLWNRLDRAARKAVRKAGKAGLRIAQSRDWDAFYPLLEENRRRHGVVPTHTLEELRRLDEQVGEALVLFMATLGEKPVGGALIMRANREVALNFYLCHDEDLQAERPSDSLAWETILWARREGFRYYDFGTSSLGGVLNAGLWRFKAKFGAEDYPRATYVLERA